MKFIKFITESPIKIDMSPYRDRLAAIFNKYPRDKRLINQLNKEFKPDYITFSVSGTPGEDDVINGATFPDTLDIDIDIGVKLFVLSNDEIVSRIMETLEHELVHVEQLKRSGDKAKTVNLQKIDASNIDQYLSNKYEIMAYAIQIVTTLRNERFTKDQIIDMIRRPDKWSNKLASSRSHLEIYLDVFKHNSYQIKRLKKTMTQFLEGNI